MLIQHIYSIKKSFVLILDIVCAFFFLLKHEISIDVIIQVCHMVGDFYYLVTEP